MNSKLIKKPRFYFNSQETARTTIFWLFVVCFILLIMTFTSNQSYKKNGYITVPQKSGSIEIHGPDAMITIYFYAGCSIFFFSLGSYFSFMYFRIQNAQRWSSNKLVPEKFTPLKVICPSCLKKQTICASSNSTCVKCKTLMEDEKHYFAKPENVPKDTIIVKKASKAISEYEKFYKSLYPDFSELSVFLLGYVLFLLILFNPECRKEAIELYTPAAHHSGAPSIIHVCLSIGASIVIIFGVMTSFIHLLIVSKKDYFSVFCMKIFGLLIIGFVGFKSGLYVLGNQSYLFMISPAWNILMGAICYSGLGMIDEIPFNQDDSKFMQTFLSLVLISIIFYFLNFVLKLYWPIIFSICINYVVCINKGAVNSKFLKLYSIQR